MVEYVEQRTDKQIEPVHRQHGDNGGNNGPLTALSRLDSEQSLDHLLIGSEGDQADKESTGQICPEYRGVFEVKLEIERAQTSGLLRRLHSCGPAAVDMLDEITDYHNTGDNEEQGLKRTGPDDRFDAAKSNKNDADKGKQGDRRGQGPAHNYTNGHTRRV